MKTKFKIFLITILLLFFSLTYVFAMDMQLNTVTNEQNTIQNEFQIPTYNNGTDSISSSTSITNPTPTVSHTSSSDSDTLSVSDIIDVILIAVCVVLIFLAIAILIRCK